MTNKTVLITGASGGIGEAIAHYLADSYTIVVHYNSSKEKAEQTVNAILESGGNARSLQFDISDAELCKEKLLSDMEKHAPYYGVICNAGITRDTAFPAMTSDEWNDVIQTNLYSFYNVLNPIVMPMIRTRKPGRIITMASISGIIGNRGQTNYSASKAGIIAATKSLAIELAKRKITVNCVAPGVIETEMTKDIRDEIMDIIPLKRAGTVNEVASLIKYLLSTDASYITRQVISVDGGMH